MNIGKFYKRKTKVLKLAESGFTELKDSPATITIHTVSPRVIRKAYLLAFGVMATAEGLDREELKRLAAESDEFCQFLFPHTVEAWTGFGDDGEDKKGKPAVVPLECTSENMERLLDVFPALAMWVNTERSKLQADADAEQEAEEGN